MISHVRPLGFSPWEKGVIPPKNRLFQKKLDQSVGSSLLILLRVPTAEFAGSVSFGSIETAFSALGGSWVCGGDGSRPEINYA